MNTLTDSGTDTEATKLAMLANKGKQTRCETRLFGADGCEGCFEPQC